MSNVSCGSTLAGECTSSSADAGCETPVAPYPCGPDNGASPCQEDHTLQIFTNLYGAALATGALFITPACSQTAIVFIPGLTLAHIGSYVWSSTYGYYEIIAYNSNTQEVTIRNNCTNGNTAGGVEVPACSTFIVAPSPAIFSDNIAYLSADFVIPAIGLCTTVSMTSTSGLVVGTSVGIASGQYEVNTIIDETSATICNTGLGGTPGATVTAINPSTGQYNYPIVIQNNNQVLESTNIDTNVPFSSALSPVGNTVTITYTNPSTTKSANLLYCAESYIAADCGDSDTDLVAFSATMSKEIDGVGPTIINDQSVSQYSLAATATPISKQVSYSGIEIVAPGATKTIKIYGDYYWFGGATATMFIHVLKTHVAAIVIF